MDSHEGRPPWAAFIVTQGHTRVRLFEVVILWDGRQASAPLVCLRPRDELVKKGPREVNSQRCPAGGADGRRSPKISPEDQTDVTTGFAGPDLIQMNIKNEDVGRKLSQGCLQVLRGGLGRPLCRLCLYRARRGRTDRGTHGFNVAA